MDFSVWIVGGLMVVVGATWLIVYNADLLLGAVDEGARPHPVAGAGPARWRWRTRCANRFRTGVTLAMFTLVVFTIVVGATTSRRVPGAFDDVESFGGGFDVRAAVARASPIDDPDAAIARARPRPGRLAVVGSAVGPAGARPPGGRGEFEDYPVRGVDAAFLAAHDVPARRARATATAPRARSGTRYAEPELAVVDAVRRAAP